MSHPLNRRSMLAVTAATAGTLLGQPSLFADIPKPLQVGPMIGHVSETTAIVWFRPGEAGKYVLHVFTTSGEKFENNVSAEATEETDFCLTWQVAGLHPGTRYHYTVSSQAGQIVEGEDCYFVTAPEAGQPQKVCLALGSCADMKSLQLWTQMEERGAQGLVLLGDTPYIDSTDLAFARTRHREFLNVATLAKLIRHTPTWGTWDDHDFGRNDSDGRLEGKEQSRRAFCEYRANREYGQSGAGIYTRCRFGPVEVFLLDTRWFARVEQSPVDNSQPTLLGRAQWEWLQESLRASTAPFKVIACGMIWDDKQNSESDDWGTYTHERDALFQFLGREKITGVVLIGGDIHCSRWLRYKTEKQVGYPIHQFIVSPIHERVIPTLNVAHPDLIQGAAMPHVWLRLEVDSTQEPARLHAEWVQMEGKKMWTVTLTETDLTPG